VAEQVYYFLNLKSGVQKPIAVPEFVNVPPGVPWDDWLPIDFLRPPSVQSRYLTVPVTAVTVSAVVDVGGQLTVDWVRESVAEPED
jgi:hypothetical protein